MHTQTYPHRPSSRVRTKPLALLALAAIALLGARSALAQVPSAVGTSPINLTPNGTTAISTGPNGSYTTNPSGFDNGPTVADACGNTYVMQVTGLDEGLIEIAAGTLAQTVLSVGQQYYNQGTGLAIDPTQTYLYYPINNSLTNSSNENQWYSNQWSVSTISNCKITSTTAFPATGVQNLFNGYFGTADQLAVDKYGSVYFVPSADANYIAIVECDTAIASSSPKVACTAPPTGNNAVIALNNWQDGGSASTITSVAVDQSLNIYFTDAVATKVYELASPYTGTPVSVGAFTKPVGLSVDLQGNLYVADSSKSILYEVPLVSGSLNFADQFEVVANQTLTNQVGFDPNGNIYLAPYPNVLKLTRNAVQLPTTNVASTGTASINYVFNASTPVASVKAETGPATSTVFTNATGGCTATTYAPGQTCTNTVNFKPTAAGLATGSLVLASSTGTTLNSVVLSGIGNGPAVTTDPGSLTTGTATLKTPEGDFIDAQGNIYVADAGKNAVYEFAAGSATATTIATGLTLNAPSGVAVDGTGNIYIADTGNNRVVEVPVVNGALAASGTALSISAASVALSAPGGLAVDAVGNLYIADTGNSRIVFVPNLSGTLTTASATAYGTGLSKPLGLAVDLNGNVYVADTGNNDVIQMAAPIQANNHVKIITGLSAPSSIAADASGSIYIVSSGAGTVARYPLIGGGFGSPVYVGVTVAAPYGVAINNSGNLFITDNVNAVVDEINRVQATLPFGVTNVGSTSVSQTATVSNSGTASLIFQSPDYTVSGNTAAGFAVTSDSCTGSTVVNGSSCTITATIKPPAVELNATETLTLKSNAINGAANISLDGTGASLQPTQTIVSLTSPTGTLTSGTPATFTAVLNLEGSTTVPGSGTVTFYDNGAQYGAPVLVTKVNGVYQASITFTNGLSTGVNTILADYSGDTLNFAASQGSTQVTVNGVVTTLALVAVTAYTNPQSNQDNAATPVTLTATLTAPSTALPTGQISFYYGNPSNPTLIGIGSLTSAGGDVVSINTTALHSTAATGTVGENGSLITNYNVFAVYAGNATYDPATSNSVPIVIVGAPATQAPCTSATGTTACAPNTTGATFTITPTNPTLTIASTTVSGQDTGNSTLLTVTSYGGWEGTLNFSCTGLPAYATCNPFPGAPLIYDSTPAATYAPTQVQFFVRTNVPPVVPNAGGLVWYLAGFAGLALLLARRRLSRLGYNRFALPTSLLLLLLACMGGSVGCGGSATSTVITPAGTYNVTITTVAAQCNITTNVCSARDAYTPTLNLTLTVK